MSVKLSKTSKMPCKSWSLEAGSTCPGSIDPDSGEPWPVCRECYAKKGFYRMPNTKNQRDYNRNDWKRADWCTDMVTAIGTDPHFRWFDSGDTYHPELARKIYVVCEATPNTLHWIPTKSWDIPKIRPWLDKLNELSNVVVRFSEKDIIDSEESGVFLPSENSPMSVVSKHKIGVIDSRDMTEATYCEAYTRGGKCGDCRACWDKSVNLIVYPLH